MIAACLAGAAFRPDEIAGVPVLGGLDDVIGAVRGSDADTVAVLACPELKPLQLRQLSWELEKTDTDLCLAPALLDVAGPRTSVRAAAGLPLLYVDHPDLSGIRQVIKSLFDKVAAATALLLLAPVMLTIALMIRLEDGGPALFKQVRVGKDGLPFRLYKFRTMVPRGRAAEGGAATAERGGRCAVQDPRRPADHQVGARLRRWSLDELPQLINVLLGQMSLVGRGRAAGRGRQVRRLRAAQAGRAARADRPVADPGPLRPVLGRGGAARPALRGELVARLRSAHPVEDLASSGPRAWCVLNLFPRDRTRRSWLA